MAEAMEWVNLCLQMNKIRIPIPIDTLKPAVQGSPLGSYNSSAAAVADITELRNLVSSLTDELNNTIARLESYISNSATRLDTATITAVNGIISNLNSAVAEIQSADITELTSDQITSATGIINEIISNVGQISQLTSDEIATNRIEAESGLIESLTVSDLIVQNSQTFNSLAITDLTAGSITTESITSEIGVVGSLTSSQAEITNLESTEAIVNEARVNEATIGTATIDTLDVEAITHKFHKVSLEDPDEFILKIPYFRNGTYRVVAMSSVKPVFSIEIHNSINNYWLSWSSTAGLPYNWLEELRIYDTTTERPEIYFKCRTNGYHLDVYYISDSHDLDSQVAPQTYDEYPFITDSVGDKVYYFWHLQGTWFQNPVDIISNAGEHEYASLLLTPVDDFSETAVGVEYNGITDTQFKLYRPDQSLNTSDSVVFDNLTITELDTEGTTEPYHTVAPGVITRTQNGVTDTYKPIDTTYDSADYDLIEKWDSVNDRSELTDSPNLNKVTAATVRNKHFFVGTRADYNSYKNNLEDDALVIIEG